LSRFVGTSVIDQTGLTGKFDVELSWADMDDARGGLAVGANDAQDTGPTLADALEDQLGLKLQRAKGMGEILVVDRIERPTPN
jgi:uncharacterized protein (TIGR03435 family)